MSLPPEALHQLISGYIDGVLSDDEATRLRDLLREDPSVAALLQGFQTNRAAMRQLGDRIVAAGNVSSGQNGLSSEFAQRVVTAAFDAAAPNAGQVDRERRAVADSTRNRDSASSRDRSSLVRYQFASFALLAAAAVAAVIFIPPWMRGNIGEQGNGQQQDIAAANNSLNDDRTRDIDVEETINADNDSRIAAAENSASAQQGVAADATANSALSGDDTPKVSTNPGTSSVNDGTMLAGNEKELIDGSQIASSEQPAMVDPAAAKTDAVTDDSADESTPQMLRMLFVVHVKLTDEGRESQAIEGLMRSVGIDSGGQHRVGNEVMDSLKRQNLVSANPVKSGKTRALLVRSGAKVLDELLIRAIADNQNFAGFGFQMAIDPPLVRALEDISETSEPTRIQQGETPEQSRQMVMALLNGGQAFPGVQASQFRPLSRRAIEGGMLRTNTGSADLGPDPQTQMLLLVQ